MNRIDVVIALPAVAFIVLLVGLARNQPQSQQVSECPPPSVPYLSFWERTDFCNSIVDINEIISGGPPPDGIPPIDNPTFETIELARAWLQDQSPVLVFAHDGQARAYPLAMMTRHEIVNDTFDDLPVAITYCPLCNSGLVFEREVDGVVLRFGVSGLLRNSDLVMWDDVTQSWWQQFTGEALVGNYAGTQLNLLPSQMVSFAAFAAQYPDGMVLQRESGYGLGSYGGNPYPEYDSSQDPFLFFGTVDSRLPATERVLAGTIGGEPIAYPFSLLAEVQVVNDTVGGEDVVAFWQPGVASALDGPLIDSSRDVGMALLYNRHLDDRILTFMIDDTGLIRDEQTNSTWNVFGTAIGGDLKGAQLRQELAAPHFWFAWATFRPETALFTIDSE